MHLDWRRAVSIQVLNGSRMHGAIFVYLRVELCCERNYRAMVSGMGSKGESSRVLRGVSDVCLCVVCSR